MIVLIGRPNVGKSTLFNRLTGQPAAVVSSMPGTTVNRKEGICHWQGKDIEIVDLAGFPLPKGMIASDQIMTQINQSLKSTKAIVLVMSARDGVTQEDQDVLAQMRTYGKPIILVVNKVESNEQIIPQFPGGITGPFYISALHGRGITELLDALLSFESPVGTITTDFTLSIIGRTNVGKSTLFNALLKEERSVVSPEIGTTRDPIEAHRQLNRDMIRLIDTAGIRRRGKIETPIERQSVTRAFQAIDQSDAVISVIDAVEGPTRQDIHVLEYAKQRNKPLLIVVNKWDAIEDVTKKTELTKNVTQVVLGRFPSLKQYEILPVSGLKRWNTEKIFSWFSKIRNS